MRTQAIVLALLMVGCSTVRGAANLDEMSQAQFDAYATRSAAQIGVIAKAALDEGDISPESLVVVAEALSGVASGTLTGIGGGLGEVIDMDGYGAAALTLAVLELDNELAERGALEQGGALSPRAREVAAAVAVELFRISKE